MTLDWEAGVRDPSRVAAVSWAARLGLGAEDAFDRLTELATELVGVSRACITLVDSQHTHAKSIIGFPEGGPRFAPIEYSFCKFVVASGSPLVVADSRRDPRTSGDPAIEAFEAGSWAGYPLEDADGQILGTFCLMDPEPHEWTATDLLVLATLAKAASSEIALRISQAEALSVRQHLDAVVLSTRQARDGLVAHLQELVSLGGPSAEFARQLRVWLDSPQDAPT